MIATSYTIRDLSVRYGTVEAVRGISFDVARGSSLALVGHNGAGKSSALLALGGGLPDAAVCAGIVRAPGPDAQESLVRPQRRHAAGISLVPERDKVFRLMSVADNLAAGDHAGGRGRVRIGDVYVFFPRLADRRDTLAGNLSGGEQQMLAVGMALLGTPELLLIDEPTLGLAVPVIESICVKLADLRRELDLALVVALAEATWVVALADTALIMDRGETVGGMIPVDARTRVELEQLLAGDLPEAGAALTASSWLAPASEAGHRA